jgi:hypothetical protein
MRPLRWVSKSHAKPAAALCAMGHQIAKSRPGSRREAIIVERRLSAHDRLIGFVEAATNCATSSVPGPALINIFPPTTVGSTLLRRTATVMGLLQAAQSNVPVIRPQPTLAGAKSGRTHLLACAGERNSPILRSA